MSKENFYEVIEDYVKKADPNASHSKIARQIIQDGKTDLKERTVRKTISEYRSENDLMKVSGDTSDVEPKKPKWRVEQEFYKISYKKSIVTIGVDIVDEIFLDFSSHGKNLSQQEVIQKYDLKPEEWHAIKGALNLYKASDIFSPWTVENTSPEVLQDLIEEKMSKLFRSKDLTIKSYRKALEREYKKAIHNSNSTELEVSEFISTFLDKSDQLDPIHVQTVKNDGLKTKEGIVVIADLHCGAETDADLSRTPRFDEDLLRDKVIQIAEEVNQRGYDKVHVVCLGDLIESFTGLNHKNSWKGIQKGRWGANAVILAYQVLGDLISNIKGFHKLYTVAGNHDRSTSSNKEDTTGEISRIITFFLKESTGEKYVEDLGDIGSFEFGEKLNIIPTHGHLFLSRQNASTMSWKYGKQGKFNLILQGHLHSRIIKNNDDGLDFRKLTCPSVFTGNLYSDQAGFDGSPGGYLIIEEKYNGTPRVIDEVLT